MADESIIANLQSKGFDELIKNLDASAKGFTQLENTITEAQKKLSGLDKNSQDFKDLTKEINAATTASNAYAQSSDALTKDLRTTNNEIGKLQLALNELDKTGQKNTQTYREIAKTQGELKDKAGELKNTITSLNAEIKNSGSDTKNLDKALRAINTVASGYQAAQGALVLFGGENKKFEQTLLKLNAVMALTQGLQQIQQELSQKDSIFTAIATRAKIAYAAATASSSIALNAFRLALIATGIGAFVVVVGLLVANWDKLKTAIFGATISLDDFNKKNDDRLKKQQEANDLLETELKYKVASGQLSKEQADQQQRINNADRLQQETKELNKQLKIKEELLKNQFVVNRLTGQISQSGAKKRAEDILEQQRIIDTQKSLVQKTYDELTTYEKSLIDKKKDKLSKVDKKATVKDLTEELDKQLQLRRKSDEQRRDLEAKHQKALEEQQKLESEKRKLDLRKEQSDIEKAESENIDKRLKANKELQDKLAEQNKERQEADQKREAEHIQKVSNIVSTLSDVISGIANITGRSIEIQTQRELAELEEKRKKGIISEKKFQQESARIKNEAAEKQRKADIAFAVAKIPLAVLTAYIAGMSVGGPVGLVLGPVMAVIAGAFSAAEVGLIAAAPLPKFKDGGQVSKKLGLIRGKSHSQGGVPIEVEGDEYVMPVKQTKENIDVLKDIHKNRFKDMYIKRENLITPDIFANIPNPANISNPFYMDKDDYSSINERLDKLASEMWWIGQYTKQGNKDRNVGTQILTSKLSKRFSNPNL